MKKYKVFLALAVFAPALFAQPAGAALMGSFVPAIQSIRSGTNIGLTAQSAPPETTVKVLAAVDPQDGARCSENALFRRIALLNWLFVWLAR